MIWSYRVIDLAEENNGEPCLKICEVYYPQSTLDKPDGYADATVMGETYAELCEELRRMTEATLKPILTLKDGKLF